jgi:hypothetical protein
VNHPGEPPGVTRGPRVLPKPGFGQNEKGRLLRAALRQRSSGRTYTLLGCFAAASGRTFDCSPILAQMKYTTAPTTNAATGAAGTV